MATIVSVPNGIVPTLPDVVNRKRKHVVTDLQGGDQLHFTASVLGFPKGSVQAIYGYCVAYDEHGQPYSVKMYVRPLDGGKHAVAYTEREARRYPATNQREQWFGSVLMYLTEIDLTDYADCLRLERLSERVLPILSADCPTAYRQAA